MSIRVQVTLDPVVHETQKREARRRGLTLPVLLTEALIASPPDETTKPWMKLAGMINTGDPHSSRQVAEIYDDL